MGLRSLIAAALMPLIAVGADALELTGTASRIIDGDTLAICNDVACHKVRLCGIDAPESGKSGAAAATLKLTNLAYNKPVRCVQVGNGTPCDGRSKRISRDRIVAQCFVGAIDIAAAMVRDGRACDAVRYSGGAYSKNGGAVCAP